MVVAVGSSLGNSFRFGLVSSLNRRVRSQGFSFPRAIQTDIPAEAGAVGGVLANTRGEMVGLLAFSYAPSQGSARPTRRGVHASDSSSKSQAARGSVMAIPTDLLTDICNQLRRNGRVQRGAVEASFEYLPRTQMRHFGLDESGAQVCWVASKGPADQAGLKPGDLVVQVNERRLRSRNDLNWFAEMVEYGTVGDTLAVKVYRWNEDYRGYKILNVRIGARRETYRSVPGRDERH